MAFNQEPREPLVSFCRTGSMALTSAMSDGHWQPFKRLFYQEPGAGNPNICNSRGSTLYFERIDQPYIIGFLLRKGARLTYQQTYKIADAKTNGGFHSFLPHNLIHHYASNWPAIYVVLYLKGLSCFTELRDARGQVATDCFDLQKRFDNDASNKLEKLDADMQSLRRLVQQGEAAYREQQYKQAFTLFQQAAQGLVAVSDSYQTYEDYLQWRKDNPPKPYAFVYAAKTPALHRFFQEEAALIYRKAAEALVADIGVREAPAAQLLEAGQVQMAKRLHLISFITDTVLRNTHLAGREYHEYFIQLIGQWQLGHEAQMTLKDPTYLALFPTAPKPAVDAAATDSDSDDSGLHASRESLA